MTNNQGNKLKDWIELSRLKIMFPVSLTGFTGYFIFDPTNPHLNFEKDTNKVLNYYPSVYPISEENFNAIKNGGLVNVKHEDMISDSDGNFFEKKTSERIYGGPKINK